jgi:hypothetical protein
VAVDMENLVGCSPLDATPQMYADAVATVIEVVAFGPDDQMIVATNPDLVYIARDAAPRGVGLRTRGGPNGADSQLIEELSDTRRLARQFSHVVVASGDKAFVDVVCALNEAGLHTTVVSLPGQLAAQLRFVARTVLWLPTSSLRGEAA